MFGIPNPVSWLRTAVIAALAAGAVGLITYAKGHSDGRDYERAKAALATLEQLEERGMINEEVRSLDDCDLLVELGVVSLPDECAE